MREHNNDTQLVTGRQLNILYFMVAYMLEMTDFSWLLIVFVNMTTHTHLKAHCCPHFILMISAWKPHSLLKQNINYCRTININWLQLLLQNAVAAALPARDCLNSIPNQELKFQYCPPPGIYFSQIDPSTTRLDRLKWWERTESMCRQG